MAFRTLDELTPVELENLTFDLLQAAGLHSLVWRTPGADGGRDLEGEASSVDFSGYKQRQKWYIECKHYTAAIDWATLWNKIAHADAANADFLLLVTNNNPSPTCETRISEWNESYRRTKVRVWRGYELDRVLGSYPLVAIKYGLKGAPEPLDLGVAALLGQLMKVAQAAYAALVFEQDPQPALEFGSSLSELLSEKLDQLAADGNAYPRPFAEPPSYDWLRWIGGCDGIDAAGLRAMITGLYYMAMPRKGITAEDTDLAISIRLDQPRLAIVEPGRSALAQIAIISDFELTIINDVEIHLQKRLPKIGQSHGR